MAFLSYDFPQNNRGHFCLRFINLSFFPTLDYKYFKFSICICILLVSRCNTHIYSDTCSKCCNQIRFLCFNSLPIVFQWSHKLQTLEFQEMVMFLQHLPTQAWTHHELEMVLSRAYMWHTMFNSSPSHLAS